MSTREYWDDRASQYGVTAPGINASKSEADMLWTDVFSKIANCDTLLDLGCGSGRLYDSLKNHCRKYIGVDWSEEMLQLFRDNHPMRIFDRLQAGDAEQLPFSDASFDVVVCSVFLQHVVENDKFLRVVSEIKRVLKIGGFLYLCEAMTSGILIQQPYSYQKIRPLQMYTSVFNHEIPLENQEELYPLHHFLIGQRQASPPSPSGIIVDLGSGRGKTNGAIGIDRRAVYSYGKRITDVVADAEYLPLRDQSVNTLIASNLLEHFENPYPILLEIHRVLNSECKTIIIVPYPGTMSSDGDPTHKFIQDPERWMAILSGFFGKVTCVPVGVRWRGVEKKWVQWQKKLLSLGFYEMAQGGEFHCSKPLDIPEFRYVPWWLEEYVKKIAGEDLL